MKQRFTQKFSIQDFGKVLQRKKEVFEKAILNRLQFVGEKFVKNARENHTYKDQTGNLTISIGYMVLKDGKIIQENFTKADKRVNTAKTKNRGETKINKDGAVAGKQAAETVAKNFPKGLVLIVVAGMNYSAAVESKNYDVITASSFTADSDLKKAIQELKSKI